MHIPHFSHSLVRQGIPSLALSFVMAFSGGCALVPQQPKPPIDQVNVISPIAQHNLGALPFSDQNVTEDWWMQFNDSTLNALVLRAEKNNLDIKLALNRIEQARAQLGISDAHKAPQVSAFSSVVREDISDNGKFAALGAKPDGNSYWQAEVDISWELDLWGRLDYLTDAAKQGLNASVFDAAAVQVLLRANIVSHYFELRGAQQQLALAQREYELSEKALNMVVSRYRNGATGKATVAQTKAKVANIAAQIPYLQAQVDQLMNRLASLSGEPPRTLSTLLSAHLKQPSLPNRIPLQLDGDLAQQRPDIKAAAAKLRQAVAATGAAHADFYPSISLNGRTGFEAFNTDALSNWDAAFFSVGPYVYLPIFQGGKLERRLTLTQEKQAAAALEYRKTVLKAWHEVDDALTNLQATHTQYQLLNEAYNALLLALHHTKAGYAQGSMSRIDVIQADEQMTRSEQLMQQSQTKLNVALVTLYKALGGGWQQTNMPQEDAL